jgi:hypothetical protein
VGVREASEQESEDGLMPTYFDNMLSWGSLLAGRVSLPFEVLNLRSFLARMAEEGRPVVAEDAIEKLEGILKKVEETTGAHLATPHDVAMFVAKANSASKTYEDVGNFWECSSVT